jgi:hypothetical protein
VQAILANAMAVRQEPHETAAEAPSLLDREPIQLEEHRWRRGNGAAAIEQDLAAMPIALTFPCPVDVMALPKRPWLVPGLLMRRQVTLLIAPPGIGKTLLTGQFAIMCAAPINWGSWQPRGRCKVLMINSEEDGDEMMRRIWASAEVMDVDQELLRDTLCIAKNPSDIVVAKADSRSKTVTRTPMINAIAATVREQQIDLLIVDPFAETFIGDENSNSELKWCAVLWREVARFTDCAVLLVHHAKKYSHEPGDMDAARGGGALAGVARIVCTMFGMSEKEALTMLEESEREERHRYLRFDDAKSNQSLVSRQARWFEKQSKVLPHGPDDDDVADEVGVLVPWKPRNAFEKMTVPDAIAILDKIDAGIIHDDGTRSGVSFVMWERGQRPKYWVGDVVLDRLGCTVPEAKDILKAWLKNQVIETFTAIGHRRHPTDGNVRSVPSHRPGRSLHEE